MKQKNAFALIMGIVTASIISFTLVEANIGFQETFLAVWLRSWVISYAVVVPAILFIDPKVQLFVEYLFKINSSDKRD
jgi:hypothetical protein